MHRSELLKTAAAVAVLLALVGVTASAQAQDRQRARQAYERGTQAYKQGDYAAAALAYREADDAAPSPVALQAALDAAVKADDPVLGGELLERAQTRKVEGALANSAKAAEAKLGHRAGKLRVTCSKPCTVTVDGDAMVEGSTRWAKIGDHTIAIAVDGRQATLHATVSVDQTAEVAPPAQLLAPPEQPNLSQTVTPPPPLLPVPTQAQPPLVGSGVAPPPAEASHGIGRGWFWAGLGVAVAGGLGSALFLANTQNDHDKFVAQSCATKGSAACSSIASDGLGSQIAGDVFLGIGVVATVWTVVSGIWLVHWSDSGVRISVGPAGGSVFWTQSF